MSTRLDNMQIISPVSLTIEETIASGGMGIVYRARLEGSDGYRRIVALKMIREEFSLFPEFRHNFTGEARLAATLLHPNIVQTFHLGEWDQRLFMVMEYVDGLSLEELLSSHRLGCHRMPVELAVHVIVMMCEALEFAHGKRNAEGQPLDFVHRDVSPRNLLISSDGQVKLTDFGIAKARDLMYNKEGEVIAGKSDYLSPEQALKEQSDNRADIFSAGVVLAEMLAGENIFADEEPEESRHRILKLSLPDFARLAPGVDRELNQILHKAMERDRNRRYQRAGHLADALLHWLHTRKPEFRGTRALAAYVTLWLQQAPLVRESTAIAVP